jgi:hypothetical protein
MKKLRVKKRESMLTEDERNRIRAEEIFRRSLEKEFIPPVTLRSRVWQFLNSGVGLWLLATVAVGGITTYYSRNLETKATRRKEARSDDVIIRQQKLRVQKVDLEIEGRLSQYLNSLRDSDRAKRAASETLSNGNSVDWKSQAQNWYALKGAPSAQQVKLYTSIFPEFRDQSLVGLLVDLSARVSSTEREPIQSVLAHVISDLNMKPSDFLDSEAVARLVHKDVLLPRWQTIFPYVRCPSETPFCQ